MLAVRSETIRSDIPWGAQCVGNCKMMRSVVSSVSPHSQFENGARPHLCIDEQKRPTPKRKRLSLSPRHSGKTHARRSGAEAGHESMDCCMAYLKQHDHTVCLFKSKLEE